MDRTRNEVNVSMLREIMQLQFAVIETVLYLNTHPFDERVLDLHNNFSRRLMNKIEKYSEKYGPIVPDFPDAEYPWSWINEPWPWQIQY